MPPDDDIMGLAEAVEGRKEMMGHARTMAVIAGDESRRWGDRYEAAVVGDHCLDIAKEYDAYIREFCKRS
jgi:hypothetical protein